MKRSVAIMNSKSNSVRWAFNVSSWVPNEDQVLLATSCIQQEEKERIGRFVFRKDAKSSLIGRLLMRKYVSDYSNLDYSAIRFSRDERGKPFLIDGSSIRDEKTQLNCNISHQGDYAVLAGEPSHIKVGIDVMKLEYAGGKSLSEFFRLMTRNFSTEEWVTIKGYYGMTDQQRLSMFCRHWCLKESYVKATGTGITVDLQSISFKIATRELKQDEVTSDTKLSVDGKELTGWCFQETLLNNEHCVAVALNSEDKSVCDSPTFQFLEFNDLMKGCEPLLPPDPTYSKNFLKKEEKPS